jgi:pectinesterase
LNFIFHNEDSILIKCLTVFLFTLFVYETDAQDPKYPSELTVAQDGTGHYKTIQEAVNAVRDLGEKVVSVLEPLERRCYFP